MFEQILIRMPNQLDLFLAGAAVVQDYWVQLYGQLRQGIRKDLFQMTVEIGEESHFFLAPLFPRMELIYREDEVIKRGTWDCILDLRDMDSVLRIATANKKHVTDAWGIKFGASAQRMPELGGLAKLKDKGGVDVLIDEQIEDATKIQEYFALNYPEVVTEISKVAGNRVSLTFERLSRAGVYVGPRGGATYLGSTMGKAIVECYPDDLPLYFLSKNSGPRYRALYGETFPVSYVWNAVEEVWLAITGQDNHSYDLTPQQEMTIG